MQRSTKSPSRTEVINDDGALLSPLHTHVAIAIATVSSILFQYQAKIYPAFLSIHIYRYLST
ncbi:MAG: hypothetical protein ACHBN1_12780 [Heteroscytonema crispum UTEX LB 1556]